MARYSAGSVVTKILNASMEYRSEIMIRRKANGSVSAPLMPGMMVNAPEIPRGPRPAAMVRPLYRPKG